MINKIPGVNIDKFTSPDLTKMITGVKDGMIGPDGGLIVSGPKGTYSLDANDSVIAGTNLNKPTQSTSPNVSVDLSPLLTEMKALREEQAKSNDQPIMVQNMVDSTNYGTALAQNAYKIQ